MKVKYDPDKQTIVCDIDNVVVDSGNLFAEWLLMSEVYLHACKVSSVDPYENAYTKYNPAKELNISDEKKGILFNWWKSDTLYDNLNPIEGSVDTLNELSKKYNIVFASHIEGNHGKSKVEFIKKWFPMTSAFAATRQKNMVKSVVNIDDRVEHLINLSKDSLPILYKTTWDNPEHSLEPQTWETISYFIKNNLK